MAAKKAMSPTITTAGLPVLTSIDPAKLVDGALYIVPLSAVFADYNWNGRSGSWKEVTQGDDVDHPDGLSYPQLRDSIAANGQETACTVVPLERPKGGAVLDLVEGFRRFAALSELAANGVIPTGMVAGTIRVVFRSGLSESQQRLLNIRENTEQQNLSGPDLAWSVGQLIETMKREGQPKENYSSVRLAQMIGRNQSYVALLMRILDGLPAEMFVNWRTGSLKLGVRAVDAVAALKDKPTEQKNAWNALVAGKAEGSKKGADVDPATKLETKMVKLAGLFGIMTAAEYIDQLDDSVFRDVGFWAIWSVKVPKGLDRFPNSAVRSAIKAYKAGIKAGVPTEEEPEEKE